MRLIDTGVWVDHLKSPDDAVIAALTSDDVLIHPFVLGELALGNLDQRSFTLLGLLKLPEAVVARTEEVLFLIGVAKLHGSGVGYVDAHLLASALLTSDCRLWTRDRRLHAMAERLGVAA